MKDVIWVIVSILLIVAMVGGCVALASHFTDGFTKNPIDQMVKPDKPTEPSKPEGQTEVKPEAVTDNGFVAYDKEGNQLNNGEVHEMPNNIVFAAVPLGAEPTSVANLKLRCTVTPSNATIKTIKWNVEWVNPSSEFATGKNIADYMVVKSHNITECELSCLQAFGEKIKITASSYTNPDVKDECIIDFASRLKDIEFRVGDVLMKTGPYDKGTSNKIAFNQTAPSKISVKHIYEGPYTIEDDFTTRIVLRTQPELIGTFNFEPSAFNLPADARKYEKFTGTLGTVEVHDSLTFNQALFKQLMKYDNTDPMYSTKIAIFNIGGNAHPAAFIGPYLSKPQYAEMVYRSIINQMYYPSLLDSGALAFDVNITGKFSSLDKVIKAHPDYQTLIIPVTNVTIDQGNQKI